MKENILFIQGIYDTIDLFIADLSAAFEELGDAVYILDVRGKRHLFAETQELTGRTGY